MAVAASEAARHQAWLQRRPRRHRSLIYLGGEEALQTVSYASPKKHRRDVIGQWLIYRHQKGNARSWWILMPGTTCICIEARAWFLFYEDIFRTNRRKGKWRIREDGLLGVGKRGSGVPRPEYKRPGTFATLAIADQGCRVHHGLNTLLRRSKKLWCDSTWNPRASMRKEGGPEQSGKLQRALAWLREEVWGTIVAQSGPDRRHPCATWTPKEVVTSLIGPPQLH